MTTFLWVTFITLVVLCGGVLHAAIDLWWL